MRKLLELFRSSGRTNRKAPVLVYHHLGLGDHIILSGGIKFLIRSGILTSPFLICKQTNLASVQQLYSDVPELKLIAVKDGLEADCLAGQWKGNQLRIGFEKMRDWYHFDKDFYRILDIDFQKRWTSFSLPRNTDKEKTLLIGLPKKFAFVHDDPVRGMQINPAFISGDLPVIRPSRTETIFDWTGVLEKATEIHCICSSFKHLVDSLPHTGAKLFYHHSYIREGRPRENSISASQYNWTLV